MLITILTDANSWINKRLSIFLDELKKRGHRTLLIHSIEDLEKGDVCFILSFSKILNSESLEKHRNNIVVHESDLPQGKGWSPLTWQVIEGKNKIPVSLFEAIADGVDAGLVYLRDMIHLNGFELVEELRDAQAEKTIQMCIEFIDRYPEILELGQDQTGQESFYPRRGLKDSELDINKPLKDLFSLLRTVDNLKYPAYFKINENKYILKIERAEENSL
ncbi:formyltransferase family protein [Leptospira yasudae]|uniref:formyltransferase family protein n=1 Tax=Leptospira yasudae TaxID=2202201 RepID=UPI00109101CD|nr:formyltransferase family protein [Leptospira yasudae]TGM95894.1 methionyl-tRNA formyltransferase [Leptospira yasudae]